MVVIIGIVAVSCDSVVVTIGCSIAVAELSVVVDDELSVLVVSNSVVVVVGGSRVVVMGGPMHSKNGVNKLLNKMSVICIVYRLQVCIMKHAYYEFCFYFRP